MKKAMKIFMVTIMVVAIAALSCVCLYQRGAIERYEARNNTLTTMWSEIKAERDEAQLKNLEYETTMSCAAEYFDQYTQKYMESALWLAKQKPGATIGYVLIFADGVVRCGACEDIDELKAITESYTDEVILTGNYWYV